MSGSLTLTLASGTYLHIFSSSANQNSINLKPNNNYLSSDFLVVVPLLFFTSVCSGFARNKSFLKRGYRTMATATSNALSLPSSSAFIDTHRQPASASPQCVSLPTLPPLSVQSQGRVGKTTGYCRKLARNVMAMATGDAPAALTTASEGSTEVATTEFPEVFKTIQAAWDKVEDKYAVSSLAVAGVVALWGSTGMISAIDRLPLVPGALELVGIGYTGWFAYQNLIFKPDRDSLVKKVKELYGEITGSS